MKKAIILILSVIVGAVVGAGTVGKVKTDENIKMKNMSDKHLALFLMMNQWVKAKQEGKTLATYFENNGYRKIAIYGMSYVGETLIDELKGTDIKIAYGIDKNVDGIYTDIDIVSVNDDLESVDVVVVTAITFFDEIEKMLQAKMDCTIISLEDIIYEM